MGVWEQFPYTNMQNANMDWVLTALKELKAAIESSVDENSELYKDLKSKFEELEKYVNSYFSELNIDSEINEKLDSMAEDGTIAALIQPYNSYKSVLFFGVKNDGITDNAEALACAFNSGMPLYFPAGEYYTKTTAVIPDNVTMLGEAGETFIFSDDDICFDFSGVKNGYVANFIAKKGKFKVYPDTIYEGMKNKTLYFSNVYSIDENSGGGTSFKQLITAPQPATYDRFVDGKYATYPLEIVNFSGYNALNINNFSTNEEGIAQPVPDNSAIGITDNVASSAPVFYIDEQGTRDIYAVKSVNAPVKSAERPGRVFEINYLGHIAIGCSALNRASEAPGSASMKIRDSLPIFRLYSSTDNKQCYIMFTNGELRFGPENVNALTLTKSGIANNLPFTKGLQFNMGNTLADTGVTYIARGYKKYLYTDADGILRSLTVKDQAPTPVYGNGYEVAINAPTSNDRLPNLTSKGEWAVGACRFDTTNKKPVWWDGSKWIFADGTTAKSY